MSELVRCDECDSEIDPSAAVGWLKLDIIGPDIRTFGRMTTRWHFCSFKCAADFCRRAATPGERKDL